MEIEGNKVADIWAKAAAENDADVNGRGYLMDASLSRLARVTTEAKTPSARGWISSHINQRRGYKPPKGYKLYKNLEERGRNWLADAASFSQATKPRAPSCAIGSGRSHPGSAATQNRQDAATERGRVPQHTRRG